MTLRILVIEDNPTNMDLMTYLLGAAGYEVQCAAEALAGLALARRERFDLILADILMPNMDGLELAKRLKAEHTAAPLIAVTALAMEGDREMILAAGFDGYIAKPIEPKNFLTEIQSFLPAQSSG